MVEPADAGGIPPQPSGDHTSSAGGVEKPLRFAYDDDVTRWAVANDLEAEGWVVLRCDRGQHRLESLEPFRCLGNWSLDGRLSWIVEGGGKWIVVMSPAEVWSVTYPGVDAPDVKASSPH